MSTASHRPRKKRTPEGPTSNGATTINPSTKTETPSFPLSAFLWPAKGTNTPRWILLPLILLVTFLFRWSTALWPYSGMNKPPMHGDFEAQRHWMEITINLPVSHWYFHELQWWGLDYPPLTAYHSWVVGQVGWWLCEPEWFRLYLSRGLDDPGLKVFMRASVVVSEFLVYVPAVMVCVRQLGRLYGVNLWESSIALAAVMMQPATMLIDHGHFQYNTVMLGFMVATIASMLAGRPLWSCVLFVAALGFKQMALFYAPAVAAYLAGTCVFLRIQPLKFVGIATTTIASFALLFLPLLLGTAYDVYRNVQLPSDAMLPPLLSSIPFTISEKSFYYPFVVQLAQAIHRIFPFSRGLFEDKVANIWCAIHSSGIHKLHQYDSALLSRAALGLTLSSIAPPCALLFFFSRREVILPAFAACAWGFFLCSYQVHEKNVLLPLLPMTLLLAGRGGMKDSTRAWVGYANLLACWTMFPLLKRDELRLPYFVLSGLWAYLLGLPPVSMSAYLTTSRDGGLDILSKVLHVSTYAAMVGWHFVEAFKAPPEGRPDLWVVANVFLGAAGFGFCYLWCLWQSVKASGLLQNKGEVARKVE
ncbi:hypothetical protein LTR62_005150 [Meristemomyces frigidus]|uniref:Alpha-1,3-glucosyltransferase n=1 Tax=Meristemomyces frigidus TaxID=1508187 RepID=A0AAN7TPF9_9PEZI|nr:hypothetical protein LTR62_005150 [Meristemomyces frigidus]